MTLEITKDDRAKRIIWGNDETLWVADGVKKEVVDFLLAQVAEFKSLKNKISEAKQAGNIEARKDAMRKYQNLGLYVQSEANKLQYGK